MSCGGSYSREWETSRPRTVALSFIHFPPKTYNSIKNCSTKQTKRPIPEAETDQYVDRKPSYASYYTVVMMQPWSPNLPPAQFAEWKQLLFAGDFCRLSGVRIGGRFWKAKQ